MGRDTLLAHEVLWSKATEHRCVHVLGGLNAEELALYNDLRSDRLGEHIRLEQERERCR